MMKRVLRKLAIAGLIAVAATTAGVIPTSPAAYADATVISTCGTAYAEGDIVENDAGAWLCTEKGWVLVGGTPI